MKWVLVVIIANSPVKTGLVFLTLNACIQAEAQMRSEWTTEYNKALNQGLDKDALKFIRNQMASGTCIPAK